MMWKTYYYPDPQGSQLFNVFSDIDISVEKHWNTEVNISPNLPRCVDTLNDENSNAVNVIIILKSFTKYSVGERQILWCGGVSIIC
jgi:hypothetical protein